MQKSQTGPATLYRPLRQVLVSVLKVFLLCLCTPACWGAVGLAPSGNLSTVTWLSQATLREIGQSPAEAQPVVLSDAWSKSGRSGTWIYRLTFNGPPSPAHWGLYVPRAGNRLEVVLNGHFIGQLGGLQGDLSDHAQRPHFFSLPAGTLIAGENTLELTVQGEKARFAGISVLAAGPVTDVHRLFFWRELLQTQGSFAVVVISALFALASGVLAIGLRERILTLFALASLFCAIRTAYAVVTDTPFDYRIWSWIVDTAYGGYLICLGLFCVEVLNIRRRWILPITVLMAALTLTLVPVHAFGRENWARQVWTMSMVAYSLCLSAAAVFNWWKHPSTPARMLGIAGMLAVSMGVHDHWMVFYTRDGYASFALTRYSLVLFISAMAWVLMDRYLGQLRREQSIRQQLADELQAATYELKAQFERQRATIANAAHEKERERLVHDLHDGIGLQLNTLLAMAEQSPGSSPHMLEEVRTTIDQMRMLVDNSQSFEGTFPELMGHIRHRIESRLQRAGVGLVWHMSIADVPNPVLAEKATALQHLMFELTTNVIKHARATSMTVHAELVVGVNDIQLTVQDDGIGLQSAKLSESGGLGTRSIRRRVGDLDGCLDIHSSEGKGTCYVFRFPHPTQSQPPSRHTLQV